MLKVAIISDTHLGFAWGEERQEDSFNNLEQAFDEIIQHEANVVLLAGDIFHDRIPRQEILARAIETFSKFAARFKSRPFCVKAIKDKQTHEVKQFTSPLIAIWGTHERRHVGATNPMHILEKAGLVTLLHAESILLEINSDKIGIHGLSGIPEPQVRQALQTWEPEPFEDAFNVMMLHQNFKEIMPPVDHSLEFSDLPTGFDLFVLGHVHNTQIKKHPLHKTPILVVGSTVSTQLQKIESEIKKGAYIAEISRQSVELKFLPVKTRPFFYEYVHVANQKPAEISMKVRDLIIKYANQNYSLKPIVRIKIDGVLAQNFSPADLDVASLAREHSDQIILSIDKSNLVSEQLEQQSKLLAELKAKKLSVDQMGLEILQRYLTQAKQSITAPHSFAAPETKADMKKLETIFHLLAEDELEKAEEAI